MEMRELRWEYSDPWRIKLSVENKDYYRLLAVIDQIPESETSSRHKFKCSIIIRDDMTVEFEHEDKEEVKRVCKLLIEPMLKEKNTKGN